jgi:tripartite-type tricarboxylate transporter receptor subunit TctC
MKWCAVASFAVLASSAIAAADDGYFRGKTITIINSTGNSGSYFSLAQAVSRHMPKYIEGGPTIIVKSMPGGGNVVATNFMFNAAPKDGTHIATINNSIPLHQVINGQGVQYDASKFNWLGSTGTYNSVAYVWHSAGVKSVQDLFTREVLLGGTGPGSSIVIYPAAMNKILGTKFKFILGYRATHEIDLAMERGEVEARTGSYSGLRAEHPEWFTQKKVDIILQIGSKRDPELPDVPLLTELGRTDTEREILKLISSPISLGRPYLAPPGLPGVRLATLRRAFMSTLRDPGFLDEAKKLDHDIDPLSADDIAKIVMETINAPKDAIALAKEIMGGVE